MSADGTWKVSMLTPIGERKLTVDLKTVDSALAGKFIADDGTSADIVDGTASGDSISFKAPITQPIPLTLEVSGSVAGDTISGTVSASGVGRWPFTGTRA
jgi:hypothetical protein